MSVEINISTKKCKVKRAGEEIQSEYTNMSEEKMIEIQAEAYYRAMKRIEEEKEKQESPQKTKRSVCETILYLLCFTVCPRTASKRFELKNSYDSLLVIIISGAFFLVGYFLRLAGVISIVISCFPNVPLGSILERFQFVGIGLIALLYGSIFVIAGDEFSGEKNSNKIYGYSASIIALAGCVISVIAIVLSRS